jgi:hypothetical protein
LLKLYLHFKAEHKGWPNVAQLNEVGAATLSEFFEKSMSTGLTLEDIFSSFDHPPDFITGEKNDKLGTRIQNLIEYMKCVGKMREMGLKKSTS